MAEEQSIISVEQNSVVFLGDKIVAFLIDLEGQGRVPVRRICDYLGLSWAGKRQRIHRKYWQK